MPLHVSWAHGRHLGRLTVEFAEEQGEPRLRRLVDDPVVIAPELPLDEAIHRQLMQRLWIPEARRATTVLMPSLEQIIGSEQALMEQVRADPEIVRFLPRQQTRGWQQLWLTGRLWSTIAANILRRATGAEVALTPRQEYLSTTAPGPVLEEYVLQWLATEDTVQLYELTGAQLEALARAGAASVVVTGYDPAARKVGGRALVARERYQVALSSSVAELEQVAAVLKGLTPERRFSLDGDGLRARSGGSPATVREVVLATLRALRRQHPGFDETYCSLLRGWLQPAGGEVEPRWSVVAQEISLSFSSFGNYPGASYLRYPGVRETRVQNPGLYTIGVSGMLAAGYDSAALNWTTAVKFALSRMVANIEAVRERIPSKVSSDSIVNEPTDDLVASSELQLKVLQLDVGRKGRLKLVPYVNLRFDTEFTPTVHPLTGEEYAHQKELYGSAGLVLNPGAILTEVRLAGLTKTDFAASQGQFEAGLLAGTRLEIPLWLAQLALGATLRYFPDTSADTVEDLGLILEGYAKLKVPFTQDLAVTLGADLFLYRPKLREGRDIITGDTVDRDTSVNLILSAGLTFDHAWKW